MEKSYKIIKCLDDNLLLRKEIGSVRLIQPCKAEVSVGGGWSRCSSAAQGMGRVSELQGSPAGNPSEAFLPFLH